MRISELRKVLHSQPFRPFQVRVSDGREYDVAHPDFIAISPSGRSVIVFGRDDVHEVIDSLMITSLHVGNGDGLRGSRKK